MSLAEQASIQLPDRVNKKRILLFDVDGTLTVPRNPITTEFKQYLQELRKDNYLAVVGGSDFSKIREQLGYDILDNWDYVFCENGLVAYKGGQLIGKASLVSHLGESGLKLIINTILRLFADVDCPVKRGNFIEVRSGMLNVSPIGRACSQKERDDFDAWDHQTGTRKDLVNKMKDIFSQYTTTDNNNTSIILPPLSFAIGGQISIDIFPQGWDKTYCIQYLHTDGFTDIHFFGDRTAPGGNDYEIYISNDTIGHNVQGYQDTWQQIKDVVNTNTDTNNTQ